MVAIAATLLVSLPFSLIREDPPPPPPLADRTKAAATVAEVFAADAAKAKTPADQSKLASRIRLAAGTEKEPAVKWAMIDYARVLAIQAGDAKLIFETVGSLQADLGAGPNIAIDTGERIAKSGRATPELIDLMFAFVDVAVAKDDYAAAERIAAGGVTMAGQIREAGAGRYFAFAQKRAAELAKKFATIKKDDTEALARFYFFDKHDTRAALPLLAKGKDAKLADAAKADLKADRGSAAELLPVGDAWWQLADAAPAADKFPLLLAAGAAYSPVLEGLAGLDKAKYESRARQIIEAVEAEETKTGLFLAFAGNWEFEDKEGVTQGFAVHRSGRVIFENTPGERLYLVRQGKDIVLKHRREMSRLSVVGDTLTIKLFTPDGTKQTGMITARRVMPKGG